MKRSRGVMVLAAALVLGAAACGGNDTSGSDTTTTTTVNGTDGTTTTAPAAVTTTTSVAQTTTTATIADEPAPGDGGLADFDFDFAETESLFDLAGVDSYRQRFEFTASGDAVELDPDLGGMGTVLFEAEFTRTASHTTSTFGGETFETITVGGNSWTRTGTEEEWLEFALPFDPMSDLSAAILGDSFLEDLDTGVEDMGTETVNGRSTIHYRVTKEGFEAAARQAGEDVQVNEAQLDAWVDEDGGFLVKWDLVLDGTGFDDANPGLQGRFEMKVEFYDFGAAIDIQAPV